MSDINLDDLIRRLRDAARRDASTTWYDVVSADAIAFVEAHLDLELPEILNRCYMEVSNGGFGPGYQLIGLPGGHESSWGDLLQTVAVFKKDGDWEDGWLPVIDWGCAQFSIVDCDDDNQIVTLYEGEYHQEDYTLETLLDRWVNGEVPELHTGLFRRAT